MKRLLPVALVLLLVGFHAGCAPEVGSDEWCEDMDEKDKGDWTANEAKEYAKNCVFRKSNDN